MYEAYYGLSANPFRLAPDPQFFFASSCHKRALAYLRYGLHQGDGFVVITGIPGTGKTLLVQSIFAELAGQPMVLSSLNNTNLEADDVLRAVANSFDVCCSDNTKASLLNALERFLIDRHRQGKRVLLIIDDAQNLPFDSLEELRMLSNFQRDNQPLIQIMLLGQQQLQQILAEPGMEQLTQRVIASCHLRPLEPAEIRGYIEHRLRCAGWCGKPSFSGEALALIHYCGHGIPRLINIFCDRMLLAAALDEKQHIDASHVRAVLLELQSEATGAWQGVELDAAPATDLAALPEAEAVAVEVVAEEQASATTAETTADVMDGREPLPSFKGRIRMAGAAVSSVIPMTRAPSPFAGGRAVMGGWQVAALAQEEREYVMPEAQVLISEPQQQPEALSAPQPEPQTALEVELQLQSEIRHETEEEGRAETQQEPQLPPVTVSDDGAASNVIPLPPPQQPADEGDEPPERVYKDIDAVVARRWWRAIGVVALMATAGALFMMFGGGVNRGIQIDSPQPAQAAMAESLSVVAAPEPITPEGADGSLAADTATAEMVTTTAGVQPHDDTAAAETVAPPPEPLAQQPVAVAVPITKKSQAAKPSAVNVAKPVASVAPPPVALAEKVVAPEPEPQPAAPPPPVRTVAITDPPPPPLQASGSNTELLPVRTESETPATAARPVISDPELSGLISSFVLAYEDGDLNHFVALFATNAIADGSVGRNNIARDYRELFQTTEMRRMRIRDLKWRLEGKMAQGSSDFEVTIMRRGDEGSSTLKGRVSMEVVKQDEQLIIRKLHHVTNR